MAMTCPCLSVFVLKHETPTAHLARNPSIHYLALFSGSLLHSSLQFTYVKYIFKEEWGKNQVEHPFSITASWPFPVAGEFVQHWAQTLVKILIYSHEKIHSCTPGFWPLSKFSTICTEVITVNRDNIDFFKHFVFSSCLTRHLQLLLPLPYLVC